MLSLTDTKISKLNASLKGSTSIPFDPAEWDYAAARRDQHPVSYRMAWQPGTSLVFLYSEGAMGGGGYTFILDADTGRVCELNFGGWALEAHRSSDGRYLEIIKATKSHPADLTLLDAATGNLTTLGVTSQEIGGQLFVYDFVWAPDNLHLLAFAQSSQDDSNLSGLYLFNLASGQSVNIIPTYKFYTNSSQSMAWSPDSSKLAIRCPTMEVDQIYFIAV